MTTVVSTLEIAASWLLFALVLAGCGFLLRAALLRAFAPQAAAGRPRCADLWIGVAAVIVYLLVWSDGLAVGWPSWLLPAAAGAAGLVLGVRRLRGLGAERPSWGPIALAGIAILLLANQALAHAEDYDFGLYHLGAIHYAEHYAAIPGLANLQSRFGAGDGHLLLVAFLDHGPWAGAGAHLADGLLASLLVVELASRFLLPSRRAPLTSFTSRMALLLAPALVIVVVWRPDQRISSPNLDFAAFVLVAAGMLYLAEAVEREWEPTAVLAAVAALSAASSTRPLYWLPTLAAAALAVVAARRRGAGVLRAAGLAGVLPAATALAWIGRQSILSGYPLFPTTSLRIPVDWRVPLAVVNDQNDWDHAWARWPGNPPALVLGSWHWLTAFWLRYTAQNPDVALPLLLLACLAPALLLGRGRVSGRAARTAPMLAVVVPCLATLVAWFFIAPDPRFAWAPIWIVPVALTAWAVPDVPGRPSPWLLVPAGVAAALIVALATIPSAVWEWLVPVGLGVSLLAALVLLALRLAERARLVALGVAAGVAVAGIVTVSDIRGLRLRHAVAGRPLGVPPDPVPQLVDVTTASGLVVHIPAAGADQCWQATLCVPHLTVKALALRGASIADGFTPRSRRTSATGH